MHSSYVEVVVVVVVVVIVVFVVVVVAAEVVVLRGGGCVFDCNCSFRVGVGSVTVTVIMAVPG